MHILFACANIRFNGQSMGNIGIFVGALVAVYLVPGPDMVLILQTSSTQGRMQGLATVVGLGIARGTHVALAAVGLATLLKTAPGAFELVRLMGTAYLVWLGVKIARQKSQVPGSATGAQPVTSQTYRVAVWRGLLTNITNPKALIFCSVLLPQFIDADRGSIASQFFLLGVVLVGIGLLFDVLYVLAGAMLGRWIDRNPLVQTVQRWLFASLLIGFGVRLALSGRPQ